MGEARSLNPERGNHVVGSQRGGLTWERGGGFSHPNPAGAWLDKLDSREQLVDTSPTGGYLARRESMRHAAMMSTLELRASLIPLDPLRNGPSNRPFLSCGKHR